MILIKGHGHLPIAFAQSRLKLLQNRQLHLYARDTPLRVKRPFQPFKIARRLMHVGCLNLNKI